MSNRISGTVDRLFFASAKFSAGALVRDDGGLVRFRGPFCVSEGELVTLTGQWKSDPKYGPQFDAKSVSYDLPETPEGLVQYLAKHRHSRASAKRRREKLFRMSPAPNILIA